MREQKLSSPILVERVGMENFPLTIIGKISVDTSVFFSFFVTNNLTSNQTAKFRYQRWERYHKLSVDRTDKLFEDDTTRCARGSSCQRTSNESSTFRGWLVDGAKINSSRKRLSGINFPRRSGRFLRRSIIDGINRGARREKRSLKRTGTRVQHPTTH